MLAGCQNNTKLVDQTKSSPSDTKNPNDVETQNEKILQDIKEKLLEGKVINSDFRLGDEINEEKIAQIKDEQGDAPKDYYYDFKHIGIGYDYKTNKIDYLMSEPDDIHKITRDDVLRYFGEPTNIHTSMNGMDEGLYSVDYNEKYRLHFIFKKDTNLVVRYSIEIID
ncbi:DUF4309 domain-containing protein [Shimazuella soli]|uniref:DUF4309 domain-containing protein n=1 Tax=Shimazuella soli TaxID=1892854 RepID=UPI001F0E4692|nr:DUF4309 domain-containing protein [Shimazuella soli]